MKRIHVHALACLALAATVATPARADSFDDAVNQFLKGFEYCKEAKTHLSGGRLPQAQSALQQYRRLLDDASKINPEILATSKRGMDGNLKYCQRVSRDVEVEVGMPTMNQALAVCDAAQQSLRDENPAQAKQQLEQFRQLKEQALKQAPSLNDIFTVKNQISRCERIESKIASFSKQQQTLTLSIETAREESAAYLASCQKTLDILKAEKIDDPVLRDALQGQSSAQSHKKNVRDEAAALQAFAENPQHPVKKIVDSNMSKGDRCSTELSAAIAEKQQELRVISQQFARYNGQLNAANLSCQQARKGATGAPSQAAYDTARTDYDNAVTLRDTTRAALSRDSRYGAYEGREDVARIEQQMQDLNRCLGETKTHLAALFARLAPSTPTPAAAAPAATAPAAAQLPKAQHTVSNATGTEPAKSLSGTLRMQNLPPEFALFYMPDDTQPKTPEIVVDRTGFNESLYIAGNDAVLSMKNKDNTSHRISVSNDATGFSENLARLQPRQSKPAKVSWPQNTVVTLRSDRGTFANSYIANLPTANFLQLEFNGKDQLSLSYDNANGATTAYLVMPDTDLLTFTLTKGETKSLAITRAGVPVGSLVVTGQ